MTTDRPAMLVHLSDTDLTLAGDADDIRGRTVVDRNGDDIGQVDDLLIDPDERRVRFLQVGSGGFLGLGEQKTLIPVDAIESIDDTVRIAKERRHVAGAPRYDPKLVQEPTYYEDVYGYYGYPPFWTPGYLYRPFPFR
ncbi:PRC-barrel domain containing protein [Jiangella aurantiaca]|uniref:PRC-barrel domain containing protein n=1 Tax=Jiangella aurantiaca TaxID=2530373 RepID=A0A4R5A632_9ACTN|nr:PRC-barrel domain-containing protein [Jiangella aurantiaca]TDD67508.1 PRC-barrel domain containing protein [Jiangella aurantiaca]